MDDQLQKLFDESATAAASAAELGELADIFDTIARRLSTLADAPTERGASLLKIAEQSTHCAAALRRLAAVTPPAPERVG